MHRFRLWATRSYMIYLWLHNKLKEITVKYISRKLKNVLFKSFMFRNMFSQFTDKSKPEQLEIIFRRYPTCFKNWFISFTTTKNKLKLLENLPMNFIGSPSPFPKVTLKLFLIYIMHSWTGNIFLGYQLIFKKLKVSKY